MRKSRDIIYLLILLYYWLTIIIHLNRSFVSSLVKESISILYSLIVCISEISKGFVLAISILTSICPLSLIVITSLVIMQHHPILILTTYLPFDRIVVGRFLTCSCCGSSLFTIGSSVQALCLLFFNKLSSFLTVNKHL